MADPIGLVVQRKDSPAPPSIIPAEFSNCGITLRSERGVVNKGIRISSLSQFISKYTVGLPKLGELGYYGVRELFNNAQPYGAALYPVRIVGAGATVATSTVARGTTQFSSVAEQPFWIRVEAGTTAGTVKVTIQDAYTSPTLTETYDNLDVDNFPEQVSASSLAECTFFGEALPDVTSGFVGGAKLVATLAGDAVTSVAVTYGGQGYSGTLTVVFTGGGNTGSGDTDATGTATVVNGVVTAIVITDGGSGYTTAPTVTIEEVPNVILAPEDSQTAYTIKAGQFGDPDPGSWANKFGYSYSAVPGNPRQRQFQSYQLVNGTYQAVGDPIIIDKNTTLDGINDAGSGSGFVYIPGTYTTEALPAGSGTVVALSGGTDESAAPTLLDYQGDLTARTGTYAFIDCPISLITSVDAWAMANNNGIEYAWWLDTFMLTYKETCMGSVNAGYNAKADSLVNAASTNGIRWRDILKQRSKIAAYKGWLSVNNEKGGKVWIPGVTSVIGAGFIRKVFNETQLPSIAPAGQPAVISGIFAMDESKYTKQDESYITKTLGFNLIILEDGVGYYPYTSRLMSTLNKNYDIHKERVINYHIDSFQKNLGFVLQEANTPDLRKRLISTIDFFEQDLYNKKMFDQFKGYEGAVQIKCDDDNNPLSAVIQRKLYCQVSLRIVNIVETAFIYINNVEGTLSVSSSPTN